MVNPREVTGNTEEEEECKFSLLDTYWCLTPSQLVWDHLVGLVVNASASGAEDPGFESRLRQDFFHTSDLKIGTQVATLPGA